MPSSKRQHRESDRSPVDRSTYQKIMTILGRSNVSGRRLHSLRELVEAVQRAKPVAFKYFRPGTRGSSELVPCSSRLILARIRLCADLGLVSADTGQLTRIGSAVLRQRRGNEVLSRQVQQLLVESGFDPSLLKRMRVRSDKMWFPSARQLHDASATDMPLPNFRLLLNLLVDCGALIVVQSRIYFPGAYI